MKNNINMETRTIELSLATAKEWYKGNNSALKELALQAFTESELQKHYCVRSWEEFCKYYDIINNEHFIGNLSNISTIISDSRNPKTDRNVLATKKDVEAFLALMQLKRLRDQWWEVLNWKPNYTDYNCKYTIKINENKIVIDKDFSYQRFLTFPTIEIAKDFLNCFKDLIEKAKELL